jgi:hypothetical protein
MAKGKRFGWLLLVCIASVCLLVPLLLRLTRSLEHAASGRTLSRPSRPDETISGRHEPKAVKTSVPRFTLHEVPAAYTSPKVRVKPKRSESEWIKMLSPPEPWNGPQPKDLSEVLGDQRINKARLEELRARDPGLNFLDYKFRVLAAVKKCLGDVPAVSGGMSVALRFSVDPKTSIATGTDVDPEHSLLPPEIDTRLLQCLEQAHVGNQFQRHTGTPESFVWAATIYLPVSSYPTYRSAVRSIRELARRL